MQNRRALLKIATTTTLALLAGAKQAFAESPLDKQFDRLVKYYGFTDDLPGIAVLIQQENEPTFMRCTGLARLKDHQTITPRTMFELASVSKTMTATAILILQEHMKLDTNDDIRKHITEIPAYDDKNPIKISNLLHHTSGLASYLNFENVSKKNKGYWLNSDYIGEFKRQNIPLDFPTGQKYQYNNTNYMLLAVIIDRVSGKSYGKFMREAIFDPAGMKTAFVNEGPGSIPESKTRIDAIGYEKTKGEWQETWGTPPHRNETLLTVGDGAIWCSLEDMAAWDKAILSQKLLRAATFKSALQLSKTRDGKINGYGLGWSLYYDKPSKIHGFGHTGSWGGFGTYYYHDLLRKRTIVFLGNGRELDGDKFWEALNELIDEHGLR